MSQSNVLSLVETMPQPVIQVNKKKMCSYLLVAKLFSLDADMLRDTLLDYVTQSGASNDVYADMQNVLYLNGTALVALMRILPNEFDLNGMGFLALLLDGDPALTEVQADFIRDMTGEKRGLS